MFAKLLLAVLATTSGVLWWQLSRAKEVNATLQTELAKLRLRLRSDRK